MKLETLLQYIQSKTGLNILEEEPEEEIMSPKDEPDFYKE